MKQKQLGSNESILELEKHELSLIIYLYETSPKKLNKRERAFIQEIEAIIKRMGEIEEIENSIKGIFNR